MKNDSKNTHGSGDTEDIRTLINDGKSKNSTGANINTERLAQDDNFNVMDQKSEAKRNDELLNEEFVGSADESRQSTPGAAVTLGDNGIEDQEDLGIVMGTDADVTEDDLVLLGDKDQDMDGGDDEMYAKPGLDDTDLDGDPLNEAATDMSSTGDDLDMPDVTPNNPRSDAMGQGDEENDYYSLGSDSNDDVTEGTP